MEYRKRNARLAGLWYFVMLASAPFGLLYLPSKLVVEGNAALTATNLGHFEMLFRLGTMGNLVCQVSFIFLVLALKRLFAGVDSYHEKLMLTLVTIGVPIAILAEVFSLGAVWAIGYGTSIFKAFSPGQVNELAMFMLQLREQALFLAGIFWGLWLFPFGYLTIKSGFIPKVLGVLLMIGCFSYIIDSSTALLFPGAKPAVTSVLMVPLAIGEISMIAWLLIKGVKQDKA